MAKLTSSYTSSSDALWVPPAATRLAERESGVCDWTKTLSVNLTAAAGALLSPKHSSCFRLCEGKESIESLPLIVYEKRDESESGYRITYCLMFWYLKERYVGSGTLAQDPNYNLG